MIPDYNSFSVLYYGSFDASLAYARRAIDDIKQGKKRSGKSEPSRNQKAMNARAERKRMKKHRRR